MISSRFARGMLAALLLISGWETCKSVALTRARIDEGDLEQMRQAFHQVELPILAHRPWLEPRLRSWFSQASQPDAFARPSVQELPAFWTIGHQSDPETQRFAPHAKLRETIQHGALVARKWVQPQTFVTLAGLGRSSLVMTELAARVDQGSCSIKNRSPLKIQCPDQSTLTWEIGEINYRPRACLAYRSNQLGPVTLSFKLADPQAVQRVQGHVGFSDFNARLRSDAALQVHLRADDIELLSRPFTDAEGWAPFSVQLPKDVQDSPTFHLTLLLNASQARSEGLQRRVIPCIELRLQGRESPSP